MKNFLEVNDLIEVDETGYKVLNKSVNSKEVMKHYVIIFLSDLYECFNETLFYDESDNSL